MGLWSKFLTGRSLPVTKSALYSTLKGLIFINISHNHINCWASSPIQSPNVYVILCHARYNLTYALITPLRNKQVWADHVAAEGKEQLSSSLKIGIIGDFGYDLVQLTGSK